MSKRIPIEQTDLFRQFDLVSDWAWQQVSGWDWFAKKVVGVQLITALDSVVANLVEGDGRYRPADALNFFVMARASAREARLWLEKAQKRGLVSESQGQEMLSALESATRQLNGLIKFRRESPELQIREERAVYQAGEVLA